MKLYAYLAAAAALVAGTWLACVQLISIGEARVQAKWDAERAQMAKEVAILRERQTVINHVVETQYVDRVRVIRERGATIIKEVTKYVPLDAPDLPGGFRLYHDAAARGDALPDPANGADAAAVGAQDLAVTVAANYEICRTNAEQVKAWQEWARRQAASKP